MHPLNYHIPMNKDAPPISLPPLHILSIQIITAKQIIMLENGFWSQEEELAQEVLLVTDLQHFCFRLSVLTSNAFALIFIAVSAESMGASGVILYQTASDTAALSELAYNGGTVTKPVVLISYAAGATLRS